MGRLEIMNREFCLESTYFQNHSRYMPNQFKVGFWRPQENSLYTYVPTNHPAVEFIKQYEKDTQLSLDPKNIIDDKYYKIESNLLEKACDEMLPKLEGLFFQSNLEEFEVKISRSDKRQMDDPAGGFEDISSEKALIKAMNIQRTLQFILVLKVAFVSI